MDRGRFSLRPGSGNGPDDVDRLLAGSRVAEYRHDLSDVYPRWLGWTGLIVSIPVTALGAIQVFVPRSITLTLIFSMLMMLTALWNLATGIWVARSTLAAG